MRVLLAGEDPPPGSGADLIAVLNTLGASCTYVPSPIPLTARHLHSRADVLIFSDYPRARATASLQRTIADQVRAGAGLLMVGGWGSFAGPFGGWRGSLIENLLPVRCLPGDDRRRFPGGAIMLPGRPHPLLQGLVFSAPPMICGLNAVHLRPHTEIVLRAHPLRTLGSSSSGLTLSPAGYPLLVTGPAGAGRTAALTTDAAPHWCGGFVDWGKRMVRVRVAPRHHVEVGEQYLTLCHRLIRWLAGGARECR